LSFKKIIDDVIVRRWKAVNISKVCTEEYALFKKKIDLFEVSSEKLILTALSNLDELFKNEKKKP
jgi:hypothetical protein